MDVIDYIGVGKYQNSCPFSKIMSLIMCYVLLQYWSIDRLYAQVLHLSLLLGFIFGQKKWHFMVPKELFLECIFYYAQVPSFYCYSQLEIRVQVLP